MPSFIQFLRSRLLQRITSFFLVVITASTLVWAQSWQSISQDELLNAQEGATELAIIDVRTAEEYASGHVPGAINIPLDDLETKLPALLAQKDQPIVVYCRSGRRAGIALEKMTQAGFSQLKHLDGDMLGWQESDLPMAK